MPLGVADRSASADTTGFFDFNHQASAVGFGGANPLAPSTALAADSASGGGGGGGGAGSGGVPRPALDGFDPFSVASVHLEGLCKAAMRYEARAAEVALRRSLALSQALTLACSSFATKIQLLSRNRGAAVRTAISQWLDFGYLVYFEGLISTQGTELGMLEDTAVAMDLLGDWTIEIAVAASPDENPLSPKSAAAAEAASAMASATVDPLKTEAGIEGELYPGEGRVEKEAKVKEARGRAATAGVEVEGGLAASFAGEMAESPAGVAAAKGVTFGPASDHGDEEDAGVRGMPGQHGLDRGFFDVSVDADSRTVYIIMDAGTVSRLPEGLRVGARVQIVPLLFVQGIDIKQSMANAAGQSGLQMIVNRRSFHELNAYCHDCLPVDGGDRTRRSMRSGTTTAPAVRWECQSDDGWVDFAPEVTAILEAAFEERTDVSFQAKHENTEDSDLVEYEVDW